MENVDLKNESKPLNKHLVKVSCSWKCAIIPVGTIILFGAFAISVTTGFALAIGLCVGSLGQKLGWWDNN